MQITFILCLVYSRSRCFDFSLRALVNFRFRNIEVSICDNNLSCLQYKQNFAYTRMYKATQIERPQKYNHSHSIIQIRRRKAPVFMELVVDSFIPHNAPSVLYISVIARIVCVQIADIHRSFALVRYCIGRSSRPKPQHIAWFRKANSRGLPLAKRALFVFWTHCDYTLRTLTGRLKHKVFAVDTSLAHKIFLQMSHIFYTEWIPYFCGQSL